MATATAQPAMVERLPRSRSIFPWSSERLTPILLVAPSVILIGIFVYGFIGQTIRVSLSRWNNVLPDDTFVGLRNYIRLFGIERFQNDLINTVDFTAFCLAVCLFIGLGAPVLVAEHRRGR